MKKIKYCKSCAEREKGTNEWGTYENTEFVRGFEISIKPEYEDSITKCDTCNTEYETINMSTDDFLTIRDASNCNRDLLFAMIKLHDEDPIEYELKMAQFREIAERKQPNTSNKPHCPYCNSTNLTKVSGTSRFASTLMFGIGSKKIGKQWKCNNCKSYF